MLLTAIVVSLGIIVSGLFDRWIGLSFLARLFSAEDKGGALAFYTAGRLSDGSDMLGVVAEVFRVNAVSGVGVGGWEVAYDSAIAETLVVGGLLALVCYVFVLIGVFVLAARTIDARRRFLTYLFAILLTGASVGFTPLTANRVSSIAWITIALLVLCRDTKDLDEIVSTQPVFMPKEG